MTPTNRVHEMANSQSELLRQVQTVGRGHECDMLVTGDNGLTYRMYYCSARRDLELPADGARPASLDEILEMMDRVLSAPGGFLGVIDERGGILQFLVADDGVVGVEIPDPERRGHYGKPSTLTDCKQILGDASGSFHWQQFDGLAFEKW